MLFLAMSAAAQIGLEQQQSKCGPSLLGSDMHTWSVGSHTNQGSPGSPSFSVSVLFLGSFLAITHAFLIVPCWIDGQGD